MEIDEKPSVPAHQNKPAGLLTKINSKTLASL
jgi:hypothetical protein